VSHVAYIGMSCVSVSHVAYIGMSCVSVRCVMCINAEFKGVYITSNVASLL